MDIGADATQVSWVSRHLGRDLATLSNFTFPTDIEASARWYVGDIISPQITLAAQGSIGRPGMDTPWMKKR